MPRTIRSGGRTASAAPESIEHRAAAARSAAQRLGRAAGGGSGDAGTAAARPSSPGGSGDRSRRGSRSTSSRRVDQPLGGVVLRVDRKRLPREQVRARVVPRSSATRARPDDRDRVRAGRRRRPGDRAAPPRSTRPNDSARSASSSSSITTPVSELSRRRARPSRLARVLSVGSAMTRSSSASSRRPSSGPGVMPELAPSGRRRRSPVRAGRAPRPPRARRRPARGARPGRRHRASRPDPTLSASRSRNRSSSASGPILTMNRRTAASDQVGSIAEHVVADEVDDPLALRDAASAGGPGARRPARRRPTSWPRNRPSAIVAGLPMSWSKAARRIARARSTAPSTARSVWSQRSSPGILFCGTPGCGASSGGDRGEQSGVGQEPQPDRRPVRGEQLPQLVAMRSPDRCRDDVGRVVDRRPASPARSSKSSVAARRTARSIRSASSSKRVRGIADRPQELVRRGRPGRRAGRRGVGGSPGCCAPGHRVDREVAPGEVELDRVAELDPVRPAEVGVVVVGAEGRDLDLGDVGVVGAHRDRAERVLVDGTREQRRASARAVRRWRGPSPWPAGRAGVAQRTAHDVRGMPAGPQRARGGRGRRRGSRVRGRSTRCRDRGVSSVPGTGTSARRRCARRRGTA